MTATVVIVTRDRREILRDCLTRLRRQTTALEIVVLDDASPDGTSDMVAAEFPEAKLVRADTQRGIVAQRNVAARHATGDVLVSIDDDVLLEDPGTLARTLAELDAHPRVGAVAIPYVEAHEAPRVRQQAPDSGAWATFRFAGGAHAIRRDVFERLGGYRDDLVQQGEEADLCLRMLAAGSIVRLGTAAPMLHLSAPPYDPPRACFYGRRNDLLYAWRNVPSRYLPVRLAKYAGQSALSARRFRAPRAAAHGILRGLRDAATTPPGRQPVSPAVYRLAHELKARGAMPLADVIAKLEAVR